MSMTKFVEGLTIEEIYDIIYSHYMCMHHNWCTHEGSPHVKYTIQYLIQHNLETTSNRMNGYAESLLTECYKQLSWYCIRRSNKPEW